MNHETTDTRRTDQDIYEDVIKANQNMNHQTSDTPETDGKKKRICGNWNNAGDRVQDFVLADFARKLERERDEARKWNSEGKINGARCAEERDRLQDAIRNMRDVQGRHHAQIACERLFALLPENAPISGGIPSAASPVLTN
jgi:hypothetical protein